MAKDINVLVDEMIPIAFEDALQCIKEKESTKRRPCNLDNFNMEYIEVGFRRHGKNYKCRVDGVEVGRMSQLVEGYEICFYVDSLNELWGDDDVALLSNLCRAIYHELWHVRQAEWQLQYNNSDWRSAYYLEEKESGSYQANRFEIGAYNFEKNYTKTVDKFVKDGKFIDA